MKSRRTLSELASHLLGKDVEELHPAEHKVLESIRDRSTISENAAVLASERAGIGARAADRVAAIGGSWGFVLGFAIVLLGWMWLNSGLPARWGIAFDHYPYIFLNLILSMLAAVQAPIIMMSQNRLAANDRIAARHDYEVNLRAELDILELHRKIDRLTEQLDMIERRLPEERP